MITGKGIFVWNINRVLNGDPIAISSALKTAQFERAEIKICDGPYVFEGNVGPAYADLIAGLVAALRISDISVWGWGFNYATLPEREGDIAARQVERYDLDGYIWDWEGKADSYTDRASRAVRMIKAYEGGTDKPSVFCSWPMLHNWKIPAYQWHPWDHIPVFAEHCIAFMPMCYWGSLWGMTAPQSSPDAARFWLEHTLKQWRQVQPVRPILPAGRAYHHGPRNTPNPAIMPEAVGAFGSMTRAEHCPGESWWSLEQAIEILPVWQALANLAPYAGTSPLPQFTALPEVERWRMVAEDLISRGLLNPDGTIHRPGGA